jgi:hypothetical protein
MPRSTQPTANEFKELKTILYCPNCRTAFSVGLLMEPCPVCMAESWVCVFGGSQIISAFEDQEALRMLIDNCDADEVRDVERIMGFNGGDQCAVRDDNSRIKALRRHFAIDQVEDLCLGEVE